MDANPVVIKAVQKAINNGWREDDFRGDKRLKWPPQDITLVEDHDYYSNSGWWIESDQNRNLSAQVCQSDYYEDLIYDHDFAKALWGENKPPITHSHVTLSIQPGYVDTTHPLHTGGDIEMVKQHDYKCFNCGKVLGGNYWVNHEVCWTESEYNPGWQYHLQYMVIAEDPIKYLGENL